MPLDAMLIPVAGCALAAVVLGLALHLVCTLRINRRGSRRQSESPTGRDRIAELEKRLDELAAQHRENLEASALSAPAPPVGPGFNLNRRSHALRLFRRGETPEQIAASLAMPAAVVRLLIKIHRIVMEPATGRADALKPAAGSADLSQ
jgi:hypothetical protein